MAEAGDKTPPGSPRINATMANLMGATGFEDTILPQNTLLYEENVLMTPNTIVKNAARLNQNDPVMKDLGNDLDNISNHENNHDNDSDTEEMENAEAELRRKFSDL